jgi:class 3 adenylate cyclase
MSSVSSDDPESVIQSISNPIDGSKSGLNVTNANQEHERYTLARKENTAVFWARLIVMFVLATTAAVVTTGIYMAMRDSQQESFETTFESDSLKVLDTFHQSIERIMDSSDALSIAYTSHAISSGSTFPNVTLPNYQLHASNARIMSEALVFNYQPIVTDETRKGWETYVRENKKLHFDASITELDLIQYQDNYFNQSGSQNLQINQELSAAQNIQDLSDAIRNFALNGSLVIAPEGSGPYLPIWQASPAAPSPAILNFNILTHPASFLYIDTMFNGKAVLLGAASLNGVDNGAYMRQVLSLSQFRNSIETYLGDPTSPFSYPVFDSFDLTNRTVVGQITSTFYWKLYLQNILPENRKGIVCVLSNSFNQTFTYRIDGSKATYLGAGDLHDNKYDYLEVVGNMESYLSSRSSAKSRSYTVVPLNTAFNQYSLHIYPSQDTEDAQVDNEPAVLAAIVVSVFIFTSLVFVTYDMLVARRQRIVMNRAVASGAIVSSLFPSQVRDNIYRENDGQKKQTSGISFGTNAQSGDDDVDTNDLKNSPPNAVLFEETTIMFADMVGFTAWSSLRGPVDVFELLESIYQSFDRIAQARKVFKVETIGDCYVAVAGLPDPQPDHAVIMTRFAEDCIVKMRQVTSRLADTMGTDTADLTIRIGLHSGSVTGGVLRGQKARFQLFGDTMNTASRMESTGLAGQIHATQETADALKAMGKGHWLTAREDKIIAKGKGELNTFWVTSRKHGSSRPSVTNTDLSENDTMLKSVNDSFDGKFGKTDDNDEGVGICFEI